MGRKSAPLDLEVARLAARQHGVVTHRQLLALGIGSSAISKRVRSGSLHRLHRSVYAVGHRAPSRERSFAAAVLACGDGAALSHRSAAVLWRLLSAREEPVDVSVAGRAGRRRRAGIRIHRPRALAVGETTVRLQIPVTTPARTIADLRRTAPDWEVRRATRQAEFLGLPLGVGVGTSGSRSDLEEDFLTLCRRSRIPAPEVNVKIGPWTVDFLWRQERVAVETDFYGYHRGRIAFQDDRARDLDLRRRGFAVRRYSEDQVNGDAAAVAADLRDALGLAS